MLGLQANELDYERRGTPYCPTGGTASATKLLAQEDIFLRG